MSTERQNGSESNRITFDTSLRLGSLAAFIAGVVVWHTGYTYSHSAVVERSRCATELVTAITRTPEEAVQACETIVESNSGGDTQTYGLILGGLGILGLSMGVEGQIRRETSQE